MLGTHAMRYPRTVAPVAPAPPAPGLVISPISAPSPGSGPLSADLVVPDFAPELQLRFPSAEMIDAAAALFPVVPGSRRARRHATATGLVWETQRDELAGVDVKIPRRAATEHSLYVDAAEGIFPTLEIAPGLVRIRHTNVASRERSSAAARERELREREGLIREILDATDEDDEPEGVTRGRISSWSRDSRRRLVETILQLDLAEFVKNGAPCMVTLTTPGDWLAVAPDAETMAKAFHRFDRAYSKKWGVKMATIWKREFQSRGAPHYHLWLVPPVNRYDRPAMEAFRNWLSRAWATAMKLTLCAPGEHPPANHRDEEDPHCICPAGAPRCRLRCTCSEYCRSVAAGTGVDFTRGVQLTDPKRLAIYFLKESGLGEGKAYQNEPPAEWATRAWSDVATRTVHTEHAGVGRYWGVRGLAKSVAVVELHPAVAPAMFRVLRRIREAQGVTREAVVQRGFNPKTGVVRYRKVRRRVKVRGTAGWVAVNDGAAMGSQLHRWLNLQDSQ